MDLFGHESPLLSWIEGETFFGLCSRQHHLLGHGTSAATAQVLFGHKRLGTHHDFPSGLGSFSTRSQQVLGSGESIALERTLLAYYRPFLTTPEIDLAIMDMQGSSVAHLKFRLGLLTSRFRAHHPLKACLQCMVQDRQNHGWVTWHLSHQYPGVWFCPQHRAPLLSSRVKSTGVDRFLWCLPATGDLVAWDQEHNPSEVKALEDLGCFISQLYKRRVQHGELSVEVIQAAMRAELLEKGWMTSSGNLRLAAFSKSYMEHIRLLRGHPELRALAADEQTVKQQVGRLLRPMRSGTHPLRWFVMAHWLFQTADAYLRAVQQASQQQLGEPRVGTPIQTHQKISLEGNDDRRQLVERALAGESITSLASELKVDVTTAMAWAAAAGIHVRRRPKKLTVDRLELLVQDLRSGMGRSDAAAKNALSLATVDKILRTEVGLHKEWRSARQEQALTNARATWLDLKRKAPGAGKKLMRCMEPKVYTWLYRHDQAWLVENSPAKQRGASASRPSVRWDERDLALSQSVQEVLSELLSTANGRPIRLWQVYQAVPELKPKLHVLDRLPLTKRALEMVLSPRRRSSHGKGLLD